MYKRIIINNKYVKEHRYIMEQYLGRKLLPNEMVHHINGIKDDNRIDNLEIVTNQSDHMKKHLSLKTYTWKKGKHVKFPKIDYV